VEDEPAARQQEDSEEERARRKRKRWEQYRATIARNLRINGCVAASDLVSTRDMSSRRMDCADLDEDYEVKTS
jgi:hypothetical protein